MRKLALNNEILLTVDKPVRYLGNEINAVYKDPESVDIRFAMCFPDVYEIGMSYLGIQILYDLLNARDDVFCERVYSPWTDLDRIMEERHIPLFALESQDPVKDFDFLGITIQYEMCYTNILRILDLSGIPLLASERGEDVPIVIGGGPCTYNPEPIADFFDLFYLGEGETVYGALLDCYKANKAAGGSRQDFLLKAAFIPGIYVPSLYEPSYNDDGTLAAFIPLAEGVPARIERQVVKDLDSVIYPEKPIVPFMKITQDRIVLEIMRGCIRGCRFCQAGMVYRPDRQRSVKYLIDHALAMIKSTGQEEISLSSLSSSDYAELGTLLNELIDICEKERINISLPSLRIDEFSLDIMSKVQDVRKSSLTFAPEAGTQRMRDVINKGINEEEIMKGSGDAFRGGWNRVKLYFMLGLPTETEEDVKGIAQLADKVARNFYDIPREERKGNKRVEIVVSTSFFVPKPFTPFQWVRQARSEELMDKRYILSSEIKAQLNHRSIKYNWHDFELTKLEGLFARGDRRIATLLLEAYRNGCRFDAWTDKFNEEGWEKALADTGTDLDFYIYRERPVDELLPWDFIDLGVSRKFLGREYELAKQAIVTPNCRDKCSGCGCASYGTGVCMKGRGASE
ncbi:MAG: TIGR03960 family B12-binding radical SAM protein [Lachnospiraceae bacterium]|nr:TIGR03960 family B12-binding radical SAM protein [Lachnospiraceae bacterium]